MKIPCIVIDLKTNKSYTIDQFASKLHDGLLKDLVSNKVIDNTNFKGRTELLNVTPETTAEAKVKVRETAQKAFDTIMPFLKKLGFENPKLEFAKNDAEMLRLVKEHGGTDADITARGYYYGKDGTVVINEKFATTDTAFHENFHPLLDAIEAHNPRLINKHYGAIARIKGGVEFIESAKRVYPTREADLPMLQKALADAESQGKKDVVDSLKKQIDNINKDIVQQKKEVITDFVAKIADGTFKVDKTNYEMVRDYILKLLKDLGVKLSEKNLRYLDEKGVIDLAKNVSKKFESGEAITVKDLGIDKLEQKGTEGAIQKSEGKLNGEDVTFIQFPEGLDIVNGFYSPLEKKVLELKGNKWGSGQQAWGELNKGLKADEVQATGIEEWLKSKTGGVTKQEIVDYVKDNRVELVEVVKGEDKNYVLTDKYKDDIYNEIEEQMSRYGVDDSDGVIEKWYYHDGSWADVENFLNYNNIDVDYITEKYKFDREKETKYENYQLEGGENYKEILVTLPIKKSLIDKSEFYVEEVDYGDGEIKYFAQSPNGRSNAKSTREAAQSDLDRMIATYDKIKKDQANFKSSHWDEPNIAVHLRMNTRTDVAGNKVAFVEEVQSDWGQKGKKEGFKEDNLKSITIKSNPKLNGGFEAFDKDGKKIPLYYNGQSVTALGTEALVREVLAQSPQGVASAPYVTNTKAWTKLGLKYALQNAVREGAERLAWTTGDQQAARYDLSEQVNRVDWTNQTSTGNAIVTISPNGQSDIKLNVNRETGKVIDEIATPPNFKGQFQGKNLDEVVGKELAKIVIDEKFGRREGEGLKVGGEGMKGFYGTAEGKVGILGNTAKELVKDLTGKEGKIVETKIETTPKYDVSDTYITETDKAVRLYSKIGDNLLSSMTKETADNFSTKELHKELVWLANKYAKNKVESIQQSIEITPELKAQVEKGMPQFSRSESINEPSTFTTRTGEKIGYTYDTDKVARERFDFSKLKRLGGGSDRDVFDLGDGKLLKVAKTARGLAQNIYEGDYYLTFIPEVFERGLNYVVVEKAEAPLVSNKGGAELQAMLKDLSQFTQQDFNRHNPKLIETLEKYGLEDAMSYDVIWNDFTAKRNWGLKDGEPVHVDGGTFGGVKMLDEYRDKTNLSDPEFRSIYNKSKELKKQFGDTDKYKQFSKSEVGETVESTAKALEGKNLDNIKTKSIYRGIPNEEFDANIEKPLFFSSSKKVAQHFIDGYENAREEAIAAGYDIAPHKNIIKEAIVNSEKTAIYDNDVDVRVTPYEFLDKLNIDEKTKTEIRDYIDERFKNKDIKLEAWIYYNYADNPSFFNILKKNGYDVFEIFEKGDKAYAIIDRGILKTKAQSVAETYLKAKADGTNPELVKAVEDLVGKPSGMQFSKSEIPNAPEEVSIKNAAIDEARAARGAEPVATQARQTWGDAWDKAVKKINNGESPEVLAKDIARSPRALTDVEHAMLFMNELDLTEQYWNLIDKINKGQGDVENLTIQLDDVKKKLEDNEYAVRASGTETARGLAIRRWSKKADYTAQALKAEARAANKGVELDAKTSKALDDKANEIADAQKKLEEHEKKKQQQAEEKKRKEDEALQNKAIKELEEKVASKTATRNEINTYIGKRRNLLTDLVAKRNESKGSIQRAKSEAPIDYDELIRQEIKEIAKGYFSLGNMDMDSLVKAVHEDIKDIDPSFTEREIRDAISGYRGNKQRMTKPAIDVEMQDLKKQMKKLSEIEDFNKKNPDRVKKEPTPKSEALINLENKLKEKQQTQKLWDELEQLDKEGLPKPKTRTEKKALSKEIEDLQNEISETKKRLKLEGKIEEIEQGKLPEKGEPKKPLSPELQKLQDEYNKKKRLLEISNELDELNKGNRKAPTTKAEIDADVQAAQDKLAEAKRIDDMIKRSAELDRLESDINYFNQEIDRLKQMAEETGDSDYVQMANNMQQYLDNLIEQNKKKAKESKPKTQKEIDLRNDIKKKEKELGIDGADEAKLKAAKTRMQNRIDELQNMIDTRNFDKTESKPVELDEEGMKLKAELEAKKLEADKIIEEERRKNMTKFERGIDDFNKWSRGVVLSGIPTLFKLATAGFARTFIAKPLETLVGIGLGKLRPSVYKKAIVEGGDIKTFAKVQAKAAREWIEGNNWFIDIPESIKKGKLLRGKEFSNILKTGVGEYDLLYGDKKYGLDDNPLEFFGRLHAALKSPTKRAEWLRSWELRMAKAIELGEDVSNPDVQYRIGAEAYIDAQRSIFMNDNVLTKRYTNLLNTLESSKGKYANYEKLAASLMRLLVPVVKIPINYTLETSKYVPGITTLRDFYTIFKHGLDNLTPEQTDVLLRSLKKQGVGAGIFMLGRMFSNNIGGYYQDNEKRAREEVKAGDIKIGDFEISHTLLHSPLFEIMMMGATYERLKQKSILEGKTNLEANVEGGFGATTGLAEQIPQFPVMEDIVKASKTDDSFLNWLGSTLNRTYNPQLAKNIVDIFEQKTSEGETIKRQPRGFVEQLEKGTLLQGNIPIKIADYVDVTLGQDNKELVNRLTETKALDDLSDISTKKFMVQNNKGQFIPKYLNRTEQNELNQLVRTKLIEKIKADPYLNSKNIKQDLKDYFYGNNQGKLYEDYIKQGLNLVEFYYQNTIKEYLMAAKAEAKAEKGYQSYDEKLLNQE